MIARIVTAREESRFALSVSAFAALGLTIAVLSDLNARPWWDAPSATTYVLVGLLIALGGLGPWLTWRLRGQVAQVTCEPGKVTVGDVTIFSGDVTALHIAKATRGQSVAIARGKNVVFVEVERADQATHLAQSLHVSVTPFGELGVRPVRHGLAFLQALVTSVALIVAPLYLIAALERSWGLPMPALADGKAMFGAAGVLATLVAFGLLVLRRVLPGHALAVGRASRDAHVALHAEETGCASLQAELPVLPALGPILARGDERVGAWLARLDALPANGHAYRGDAMKKDVLWDTLGDGGAPVDARMAAARVLRLRYGEEPAALARVVDDREVRVRVQAVLEEHDDAEEHLERLGPLFRAR